MKYSTYYFHMKTKTSGDFQNCISVPLKVLGCKKRLLQPFWFNSHQRVYLSLLLKDWYCRKLELKDWLGNYRKWYQIRKKIVFWIKGIKLEIEITAAIFSVIFEITSNFLIVFVRLILRKVGIDWFTEPRRKIDILYEFGLKAVLKGLRDYCSYFD